MFRHRRPTLISECKKGQLAVKDERKRSPSVQKKPYAKPELRQVPLRPEEAVLGNCKMSGLSGPASSDCMPVAPCFVIGS